MRAREFLLERTEPFQGLDLEMEFDEDEIWVTARDPSGRELGHVLFVDTGDELIPQDLEVEERFRGQGIARVMYDWVKSKGYRIRRSNSQTRAGAEFWNRNRPGENVWEQGVAEGDKMSLINLDQSLANTPPVWKKFISSLPSQLAREFVDERPRPDQDDIDFLTPLRLASPQPVAVRVADLLRHPENQATIGRSPDDVVTAVNQRWGLKIPSGKKYDPNPARYQAYARMAPGTASPSVMADGVILFGAGRFVAAALRGDETMRVWSMTRKQGVAEGIDPDTFEDLDPRIIARAAKRIVPTARARRTPEGYVYLTTEDGLDLYIGATVADGVISVNIGSGGGLATSGANKGAVTEIIRGVYDAAVRKYGRPDTPGELTIDHDAGHGVWQHIANKLGLRYDAVQDKESGIRPDDVSENFADGKKKGKSRPGRVKRAGASCKGSVSDLRARARKYGGERGRMYHWCANMKGGRKKAAK